MIDRKLNYGRHLIAKFANQAKPFSTVLDIGAGHGDDLMIFKSTQPNAQLFAIENYKPYAEELNKRGVKVFEINLESDSLPFDDESVDVIIANQILEHCKEIWWMFHELSRILKVNGKIIIGVPNLASLHNRLLLLLGEQPTAIKNNSAHVRGYTKKDLLRFINSGFPDGFVLRNFGGSNFYPFPGILAKPLAKIFPTYAWSIFIMMEKNKKYNHGFLKFPIDAQLETNFYLGKTIG